MSGIQVRVCDLPSKSKSIYTHLHTSTHKQQALELLHRSSLHLAHLEVLSWFSQQPWFKHCDDLLRVNTESSTQIQHSALALSYSNRRINKRDAFVDSHLMIQVRNVVGQDEDGDGDGDGGDNVFQSSIRNRISIGSDHELFVDAMIKRVNCQHLIPFYPQTSLDGFAFCFLLVFFFFFVRFVFGFLFGH